MVDAVDMIVAVFEAMGEAVLIARVEARVEAAVVVMGRACQRHPGAHASGGRGECGGEGVSDREVWGRFEDRGEDRQWAG